jgi:bacterioferritin-associated ferredoxin
MMSDRDYALHVSVYADEIKDLLLVLKEAVKSLKKTIIMNSFINGEQVEDTFCAGDYAMKIDQLFDEEAIPVAIQLALGERYGVGFKCGSCNREFRLIAFTEDDERLIWTCPWCGESGRYYWRE